MNKKIKHNQLLEICNNYENVYCYGMGLFGREIALYLQENDCVVKSFILSDPPMYSMLYNIPVIALDEYLKLKTPNDLVILGVGRRFFEEIYNNLLIYGIDNIIGIDEEELATLETKMSFINHNNQSDNVNILLYHRVEYLSKDIWGINVTPDNFEAHIKYLKENYQIIHYEDDFSQVNGNAIVITFDDGYADCYKNVLPILEKYQVPATFFVSTINIGTNNLFWWDELGYIYSMIKIEGIKLLFDNCKAEDINSLHGYIKGMDYVNKRKLFDTIYGKYGLVKPVNNDSHRSMTIEELKQLDLSPLVTIGAHTYSHPSLRQMSKKEQYDEIIQSKKELESILSHTISTFSYPFGDYSRETIEILKDVGFGKAPSVSTGLVKNQNKQYELPRNVVRNIGIEEFEKFLNKIYCLYSEG